MCMIFSYHSRFINIFPLPHSVFLMMTIIFQEILLMILFEKCEWFERVEWENFAALFYFFNHINYLIRYFITISGIFYIGDACRMDQGKNMLIYKFVFRNNWYEAWEKGWLYCSYISITEKNTSVIKHHNTSYPIISNTINRLQTDFKTPWMKK